MEDVWIVPKNIRQIGESHGDINIYIEDYAATFISQFAKNIGACAGVGVCYGKIYEEAEKTNIVIEGVAVNPESMENIERIFAEEPYREAEKEGISRFPNQRMIGKMIVDTETQYVSDSRMLQMFTFAGQPATRTELALLADRENGIRGIWVSLHGAVEKLENYYIYYDRNETMQNYLIHWNEQLRGAEQEREAQIREMEDVQNIITEKRKEPFPILECATCLLLIAVCMMGIISLNNYQKLQGVEKSIQSLARNFYGDDSGENETESIRNHQDIEQQDGQEASAEDGVLNELPVYTPQSERDEDVVESSETDAQQSAEPDVQQSAEPDVQQRTEPDAQQSTESDESMTTQTVSYQEYIVKQGDTLSSICDTFYQDRSRVDEVCRLNGITDPDILTVGQKILLP